MDLTLLALFVVTFASVLILPGPNAAFSVAQSLKYGFSKSIYVPLGFMSATGFHAIIVFSGLGVIVQEYAFLLVVLKWIGVAYLLFLAFKTFASQQLKLERSPLVASKFKMYQSALLVSLTNPKALLASVLIYPLFVSGDGSYLFQAIVLTVFAMAISFTVYSMYGLLSSVFKDKLAASSLANKIVGGLYVGAAGVLAGK
ncbi:MAG: LysE family translocator [Pseudomonadales bacterium]|nr:LysE family translocator [Pseudomonadales bacterium]